MMNLELEPHILALIGAATAAAGAGLVVWGLTSVGSRDRTATAESLLAPTLAVDTLDPELRVAYMRTLVLDARLQARGEVSPSMLGRELRRCVVAAQALRHAGRADDESGELEDLVQTACDAAEIDEIGSQDWDAWVSQARDLRARLLEG